MDTHQGKTGLRALRTSSKAGMILSRCQNFHSSYLESLIPIMEPDHGIFGAWAKGRQQTGLPKTAKQGHRPNRPRQHSSSWTQCILLGTWQDQALLYLPSWTLRTQSYLVGRHIFFLHVLVFFMNFVPHSLGYKDRTASCGDFLETKLHPCPRRPYEHLFR
ncbi:hypothetical protein N431DRAFT_15270 [Stipitochalara longipes BDJ]|nr:hypothetical protein N431DRAFT_15270 [Stipitochalara longipes BDJ]